jgi:hypothetical protein
LWRSQQPGRKLNLLLFADGFVKPSREEESRNFDCHSEWEGRIVILVGLFIGYLRVDAWRIRLRKNGLSRPGEEDGRNKDAKR